MDPVDSTQGRHGRVAHHSSVMNTNDHIGNTITNHGNVHGHSSNANSIRSPVNPPVPKRNYPTNYAGQFSSSNTGTASLATQGMLYIKLFNEMTLVENYIYMTQFKIYTFIML